jgi:acyl transferase domain-containing protein
MDDQTEKAYDDVDGIAIIGMAGRFPMASNVADLWENVKAGQNCITSLSIDELDIKPDFSKVDENAIFVGAKGILDDVEYFDARFWGYTPKEAALMDPQQRIFLECAWEAMEDAGYDSERYEGAIGCFGGVYIDTYLLNNLCSDPEFLANLVESIQVGSLQTELGNDKDYVATRAAFKMNLKGPAVNVQTACSTSLVAISLACQNLLNYQSDMCLAGGVTLTLPQKKGYFYTEGGMLSRSGYCCAFDEAAAGTVFSNAGAVILLKRLSDAVADRDHIYAVIKGTALNNDGGDKQSFTAPSVQGQAEVIAMAQAVAGVDARSIGLIEAHGTATPLGDPIEVAGLTQAFRESTQDNQFCALGSLKTNIGHSDVASGVCGVIKTALALRDKVLPPIVHFKQANPKIVFEDTPFYVNTELKQWEEEDWPRRAGVSCFGVGGTNAHVVMEEAAIEKRAEEKIATRLVVLSARSENALLQYAQDMSEFVRNSDQRLDDIAFTGQVGRKVFEHRAVFVADDKDSLVEKFRSFECAGSMYKHNQEHDRSVVFMFPGQGAQYPGMARDLYQRFHVFRQYLDRCCEILLDRVGLDLKEYLFECDDPEIFKQTTIAQPAIFSVEYALAQLWLSWGIKPAALVGHSVGEYCAACISGIFDLEDGLLMVARRGEFMQKMDPGSMLSVRASLADIEPLLNNAIDVAAINAPKLCVLSGSNENIEAFKQTLEDQNFACSILHTSHAFHSAMMDDAIPPTIEVVSGVQLHPAQVPVMSTVTGQWLTETEALDSHYWARNLRNTVRFTNAISSLVNEEYSLFLEVGPGQTLSTLANQTAKAEKRENVRSLASLSHSQSSQTDEEALAEASGRLWLEGATLDWLTFNDKNVRRVPLPTYPFERKRHWVDPNTDSGVSKVANRRVTSDSPDEASVIQGSELEQLVQDQLGIIAQQLRILKN